MASKANGEIKQKKKSKNVVPFLLSCCVFLAVLCACLLTALVFIGKHIVFNAPPPKKDLPKALPRSEYFRLPNNTRPIHYDITLLPNLDKGNFEGRVNVTVNITQTRQTLVLNAKNLSIITVEITRSNDSKKVPVNNVIEKAQEEVILLTLKEEASPGVYHLFLKFEGSMLHKLVGLYESTYLQSGSNVRRKMVTSKLEPTYARQAYPCFDEPNMKATYKVHILKPKDTEYIALSNYPQESEEPQEDGILVHFEKTVPMSTYLTCFIVSDFISTDTTFENSGSQTLFRVYATPAQIHKTKYAADVGKKAIEYYVKYFGIPYPLPKLDMVAVPDFVSGAMEHWGLVTFRETSLLYSPETHSSSDKKKVLSTVAHELAHSWFGNLVTMDWWDNLWLNEGFATYITIKGADAAEPTFGMNELFLTDTLHHILRLDATQSSHPIIKTVTTPDQITEVFDAISYSKGASILRMLENTVGEENFRKGVTNYLNKYKYGSAVTQKLWDEIQSVVGSTLNVTDFMDTFVLQMGYPILDITISGNKYVIKQRRFLLDPDIPSDDKSPFHYKWTVPIRYTTDKGISELVWLEKNASQIEIDRPSEVEWVKFNPHQFGYYRVKYPEDMWKQLTSNILELSVMDRAHLLEESFSLSRAGEISYASSLDLTKFLENELEYTPWQVASGNLMSINQHLEGSVSQKPFQKYIEKLIINAYNNYTWNETEDDSFRQRLARSLIVGIACKIGYPDALQQASELFNDWMTGSDISQDLKTVVFSNGMKNIDEKGWEKVFNRFVNETDSSEKLKIYAGLASVQNPALLNRLIALTANETIVRGQDYFLCMRLISMNLIGQNLVWDYIRENWEKLVERFTLNDRYLGLFIRDCTSSFGTKTKLREMESFFALYPEAGAGVAARKQALENVKNNIKWLEKYQKPIEDWIKLNVL